MTNEQAVRWLKDLLKSDLPMEQYQKALEKGIEALEPSGDLISREETLTAFADYVGSGMSMNDYEALWDIVAKMPPVKQEPKTGHWEYVQYDYNPKIGNWHCSECRCVVVECVNKEEEGGIPLYKYCPQCGARMIEPQERSGEE